MAQELAVKSYYHDTINTGQYISTNLCVKLGMEYFLSRLLFKGDLSKVLYSKEDICFRRRVEMVGSGHVKKDQFDILGLDLPFAIYSQTGGYEPDDRGATQSAAQIVAGWTHPDTGIILHGAAVKTKYSVTAFYGRRDDTNVASQLLYWEQQPVFPFYFIVNHTLCGYPLDIPVFMTVESIDSNVDYQEKDWLTKSKIFPIKVDFTIRSYQTLIESIGGIELPLRFAGLYGINNQEIILTQRSLLTWGDEKLTPEAARANTYTKQDPTDYSNKLLREALPFTFDDYVENTSNDPETKMYRYTEVKYENINHEIAGIQSLAIEGYFSDDREVTLDEFYQVDDDTTEHEITISWKYAEGSHLNFSGLILYIPGIYRFEIKDFSIYTYRFKDLYPGSTYDLTLVTRSLHGVSTTYRLQLKTKGEPALGKKLSDNLVGRTFSAPN